ncbi:MAG: large-conductance mechanosensitive channel protein MscL [Anaerolineaceae bacterium]|nr:MAG: large-conductance mechanosensitive channel protein MscL [Anaerolineaceae bacterium]
MLQEFKTFISRGSVVDLAVGIIIGSAFTSIVNSLVNDIIMPPVGLILGNVDFSEIAITLRSATEDAEAVTMNIGLFINALVSFLIVALAVFFLVKAINRLQREQEAEAEATAEEEAPAEPTTEEKLVAVLERLDAKLDDQRG